MIYRLMPGAARPPVLDDTMQAGLHPPEDGDIGMTDSPDPKLDYITRLAVQATGADIGGISLMVKSQIWLPSHIGVHASFFPRTGSFCDSALLEGREWF